MKITEGQILKLFRIVSHTNTNSGTVGSFTQEQRKDLITQIISQQSNEIVDTGDFELMKLASDADD